MAWRCAIAASATTSAPTGAEAEGGAGADTLQGNAGYDTLSYADSNAGVTINLLASTTTGGHAAGDVISGFEALIGSDFNDSLRGNAGDNEIEGGLGVGNVQGNNDGVAHCTQIES